VFGFDAIVRIRVVNNSLQGHIFMGMIRRIAALMATVAAALLIAAPQVASAQATRTWVSGVGDDANPCSRTAPCKTFAGAISKTAVNGEINCIDPGGYGTVTITKSMIIDCKGVLAGVLNSGTSGIIINAAGAQVTLRNLDIQGTGTGVVGIRIYAAAAVQVDNVVVRGQSGTGIDVVPSGNTQVTVSNSVIRDNAQHGISVAPTSGLVNISVSHSVLSGNGATGIRVNDNGTAALSDCVLAGNGTHGATASSVGSPAKITLDRVVSSGNVGGGVLANGPFATFWLTNVSLVGNAYGFYPPIGGGTYISYGNNHATGNTSADGTPTSTISPL
jgi:hypothetical protein